MMGERVGRQDRLFYEFCLDEMVPEDHLLRRIDRVLDLSWLRRELAPFYSHTGCPSVDPELLIRMMLIGYCYSIRSDRRLCRAVALDLAFRWFCRLGLEDRVPAHATFSVNRHGRFWDSDVLRKVFESVVRQCMAAGLVKGEGFAVDASVIEADASRFQRVEGAEMDWSAAQRARRPIREYLAALDGVDTPTNPERAPKAVSPTDPCAAWTTRGRHKVMFGYSLNYLIDMDQAIIVDVEATPTRISKEVAAAETMVERTEKRFALKPKRLAGDVAYGTGESLDGFIRRGIEPHIPIKDMSQRQDGTFSRDQFSYDARRDVYVCPGGKVLKTTGRVSAGNTLYYRARKRNCDHCSLKAECCPNSPQRRVPRDVHERARDHARALMETQPFLESRRARKKIETRFGDLKWNLGLTRLRLRGLSGARQEFLLAATVQNLRRLANLAAMPPPKPIAAPSHA